MSRMTGVLLFIGQYGRSEVTIIIYSITPSGRLVIFPTKLLIIWLLLLPQCRKVEVNNYSNSHRYGRTFFRNAGIVNDDLIIIRRHFIYPIAGYIPVASLRKFCRNFMVALRRVWRIVVSVCGNNILIEIKQFFFFF